DLAAGAAAAGQLQKDSLKWRGPSWSRRSKTSPPAKLQDRAGSLGRAAERPRNGLRLGGRDSEQRESRPIRGPSALLPVSTGGHAHANHERELLLRLLQLRSDRLDVGRREVESARRLRLAPSNPPRLPDAGHQLVERIGLHESSFRTSRANTRT